MVLLSFYLVSGFVQYKTVVKTLGALPDPIVGKNKKVELIYANIKPDSSVEFYLKIPIEYFRSGNKKRDIDVAKILGYPEHKFITFELVDIKRWYVKKFLMDNEGDVFAKCKLTVKGNTREYDFKIHFKWLDDETVKLSTRKTVRFTDFGIEPPTLMGFVKRAEDRVDLFGEIVLKVRK